MISTAKHLLLVILLRMLAFVDTYVFAIMALKPVDIAEAAKMVFSHITRFRNWVNYQICSREQLTM